jgi:predicted  nucleic acid-binding Zn-ribbon protein
MEDTGVADMTPLTRAEVWAALRADLQQAQRERNMLQRQYDELALQWEVDRAELVKAHDRLAQQATRIKELEHGFRTPEVSMADATGGTNRRKKRSIWVCIRSLDRLWE